MRKKPKENNKHKNNIALIDGQNLHLCTREDGWKVDHKRFRVHLKENYNVERAYYFLGYHDADKNSNLYTSLQESGFILEFKGSSLNVNLKSRKTGNVDADIVFFAMRFLVDQIDGFNKYILVSGDGDYIKLVEYLIEKDKFRKLLFPSAKTKSSRYNKLGNKYLVNLKNVKKLIEKRDEGKDNSSLKKEKGA